MPAKVARSLRAGWVLATTMALLLLLPVAAEAATSFGLASTVGAATVVPVTLAPAGGNGCTGQCAVTLNVAATSATVGTVNILPNPSQSRQVLKVIHGSLPWSVHLRATGAQMGITDSITLNLVGPTTASMTLTSSTTLPVTSAPVQLAGGAGAQDLSLSTRGVCAGVCVLTLELRLVSGAAVYTYGVTLTVT